MNKKTVVTVTVVGGLLFAVAARTQPPVHSAAQLIPYHGYVEDGGGPANGQHDFEFSIYGSADPGASPVWAERQGGVAVTAGNFSVALGEGTTTVGSRAAVWTLDQMFLGIQMCERTSPSTPCTLTPLAGRQRILSVPTAVRSVPTGPIGEIMAIDFDAPDPDPAFWLESDGRPIPPQSRLGVHLASRGLPLVTHDLTDDRFLMGSAAPGRGGHNDGHTHSFELQADDPPPGTPLEGHRHTVVTWSGGVASVEEYDVQDVAENTTTTRTTSPPLGGHSGILHTHPISGRIGAGTISGDEEGSNRPRYQAVRYFVKIN